MATSVHHFGMTVEDIPTTQDFYAKHFGFAPSGESIVITDGWFATGVDHEGAQVKIGWLRRDDAVLELHEYIQPKPSESKKLKPDITDIAAPHIAFKVDDIDEVRDRLLADGVRFYSAPVEVTSDGTASQLGGIRWCYCEDPNGYIVELFSEPENSGIDWNKDIY
jgi:catechol 2,3-dioxygenase-like lactoylglutathione lyase family enzyme